MPTPLPMTSADLLNELSLHRQLVASQQERIESLKQEVEQLRQHNEVLRLKVDAMARKLFGRSSEKLDPAQLQMVFEALQNGMPEDGPPKKPEASVDALCGSEADEAAKGQTARKKRSLEQILAGLPVIEIIIEPEEVKADPQAWTCMGAEVTRLIDYTPGKFSCQKINRRKYVRKEARHLPPVIAPLPSLQERCIATPRLLAHTLTQRFELHLPYYRIEQTYGRAGVPLTRQTLSNWGGMCADACGLVIQAMQREVFADGYVQIDETPVKYQDPERKGTCGTGYLWAVHNPVRKLSLFEWRTGRGTACLESLVPADFTGLIQCDGYQAYESFIRSARRQGQIRLAGCLAHARRKFFEAQAEGGDARWVLEQTQQLYRIEAKLREARAGPMEVRAVRQEHSAPILEGIHHKLQSLQQSRKHLPRSLTGAAISYTLNQWDKLSVYLRDGRVCIDNNLIENAIRPSAIGKKNWLFMGDAKSGDRAAMFYTLIGNCHREGINAEAYLTDLFTRLPTETNQTVHRLTPKAWAAEQRSLHQAQAKNCVASL
ncbi:IS66-like element ISBthe6 family transposase [Prosthecobacter algae]|uniref:IS66-like element ISBthe6 family transposase n=2 Tax=Prosthecobacter algae TaxID=1144682 RepID=A0ABP9PQ59_9BACT